MLPDQKGVVRAGVDVLVHTVGNEKIDDEFIALLKEKKPYWAPVMGLGDTADLCSDGPNPFVEQSMPEQRGRRCASGQDFWLRSKLLFRAPQCQARRDSSGTIFPTCSRPERAPCSGRMPACSSQKYAYGFAQEHHEIAMYVRFGMTPAEAIQVSTSRPTEVLHIKDAGTLRTGARADFMVLDANPLEKHNAIRVSIDSVYLNGAKLDRSRVCRPGSNAPRSIAMHTRLRRSRD